MARRRVAAWRYFHGDQRLENVRWFSFAEDGSPAGYVPASAPPDTFGQFGTAVGASPQYSATAGIALAYRRDWLRVERTVRYLDKPDKHQCDFRCLGAKPGGECWCSCGGLNHGRNYRCE